MSYSSERKKQNEFVRLPVTLFLITFIVAILLALVNWITAPKIEEGERQKLAASMSAVLPEAKSFEDLTESVLEKWENETSIISVQAGKNADGDLVGYCVEVAPKGYSDRIDMMVGINLLGEIVDTSIVSISDTPSIGTKVEDEEFSGQFIGKSGVLSVAKGETAADNEIALISGATYSSSGFANGVNAALRAYEIIVGEGAK